MIQYEEIRDIISPLGQKILNDTLRNLWNSVNNIDGDKLRSTAIDGMVITGATIRTASSGSRVELSGNTIKGYVDEVKRVELGYQDLSFYDVNGNYVGYVGADPDDATNRTLLIKTPVSNEGDIYNNLKIITRSVEISLLDDHGWANFGFSTIGVTLNVNDYVDTANYNFLADKATFEKSLLIKDTAALFLGDHTGGNHGYIYHDGTTLQIGNMYTNEDINLATLGTGKAKVNGNEIWHMGNDVTSFADSGYMKLPNGMMQQWGRGSFTANNTFKDTGLLVLPTAIPNSGVYIGFSIYPTDLNSWVSTGAINCYIADATHIRAVFFGLTNTKTYLYYWTLLCF